MPEIKTRQIQKGTIRTLDRAAAMTSRLKDVRTRTKDLADDPRTRGSRSPEEYASNRIVGMAKDTGTDAVYMAEKTASWSAGRIRRVMRQPQAERPVSTVRAGRYFRFRRPPFAENVKITGRSPGIKNFANRRQLERTKAKGKEKAIWEFAKQRTVVDSRKRSLVNIRSTKEAGRKTGRTAQRAARRLRDLLRSVKALISTLSAGGIICLVIVMICILFGAAFYFFGDDSSANYTSVSPEVEAYSDVITKYAGQYGIGEYTELVKAVMMQESGIKQMNIAEKKIAICNNIGEIKGYEGLAAKSYFSAVSQIIEPDFRFSGRNRRPPKDPFNSMISLGYTLLMYEIYGLIENHGMSPYAAFLHQGREKHPTLASDMMEEWRSIIVDSVVLSLIQGHEINIDGFKSDNDTGGVFLLDETFRTFIMKYEKKMRSETKYMNTHERRSYRTYIDYQIMLLARAIDCEDPTLYKSIRIR